MSGADKTITLSVDEVVAVYKTLKAMEDDLDGVSRVTLAKLERFLYSSLTIEELEAIQTPVPPAGAKR